MSGADRRRSSPRVAARRRAAARERKRRQRARQKGGLVVRQIEVDEAAIDEWLLAAGLIHPPAGCDDPAAQREALDEIADGAA